MGLLSIFKRKLDPKERDRHLRGECIGIAMQHIGHGPARVDDTLRGAQRVYAFVEHGVVPDEPVEVAQLKAVQ